MMMDGWKEEEKESECQRGDDCNPCDWIGARNPSSSASLFEYPFTLQYSSLVKK